MNNGGMARDTAPAGPGPSGPSGPVPPAVVGEESWLETVDGERLAALHLPGPDPQRSLGVVVAHGFTGSVRRPALVNVVQALASHAGVVAFDFRGHGRSSGHTTVGDREVLDLDAAVAEARRLGYRDVVTCGWSMGGSVVLRHAALQQHRTGDDPLIPRHGVEAVVSVSAVSRWFYKGTPAMRRVHWVIENWIGRVIARRLSGTRIARPVWNVEQLPISPEEAAPLIAPTPLLVVHGEQDHYFPIDHGQAIYDAAGQPKELWLVPDFGHAENAATPELLDRIGRHLPVLVAQGR